ncbi:alpha/beta hydrolase [Rhodococcus sp. IEGM 1379]|uniref:alpha/beta hydrolase n=1 Tax=Rhodococcus sp. IEGM 1379 TaxID=3047086 RepID=UPI0024B6B3B6|nr:alpha/beta hydrolase [Rhodococcus sp. IEGM 1379]MDI9917945.1 alpha/beta hydrolase [Rhodococcus sp. IEGM 1379]
MTPQHLPTHGENRRVVVMVLPGGKVSSHRRSRCWHLSNVRMRPFTAALRRRGFEAVQVRYRRRGWNGAERSPVADARRVLDRITASDPGAAVVLLGHSMGGRVAAALSGDPAIVGVVALAPWWPAGTSLDLPEGARLLVIHGSADRWTDPVDSQSMVDRAQRAGTDAEWIGVEGAGHFMLRRPAHWHRLASDAVHEVTESKAGERR